MRRDSKLEDVSVRRAEHYARFAGILIGFSITIAVIIVVLAKEEMKTPPLYSYSLASFIYSALAFFNTYTWYGRAIEQRKRSSFLIGSFFYYTGYWGLLLGLVYLTSLISFGQAINYPFLVSIAFLLYTFAYNGYEFLWEMIKGKRSTGIIFLLFLIFAIGVTILTVPT